LTVHSRAPTSPPSERLRAGRAVVTTIMSMLVMNAAIDAAASVADG
jgi:hypothetical protein